MPDSASSGLPVFSGQTRLLVVAPHPDDETIATGLLIQQVRAAGGEVGILLLTGGDNNPWPQRWLERRVRIGAADRRRWGQRRHAEMLQALERLGLPASALESMGWPDMGLSDGVLQPGGAAVSSLAAAIGRFRPSLIAVPSIDDRHPDHGTAHVLVRLALAGQHDSPRLLTYLVHGQARATGFIELGSPPGQLANKQAALAAHGSQMALSGRRMRLLAARPERYATPAPSSPVLPWRPPFWAQPWLRLSLVGPAGARSWRWQDAPLARDPRGDYRVSPAHHVTGQPQLARLASTLHSPWIFDHWGWCELRVDPARS